MRPRVPLPPLPPLIAGPIRGVRDSAEPATHTPERAFHVENLYPLDPGGAGALAPRPGFELTGTLAGRGQGIAQWETVGGVRHTNAWAGGVFYQYDWLLGTWSAISLGAFTLDATAKVYWAVLADRIIFHDGIHKPLTWDGAVVAELANAPVAFGPIAIYYGKAFFIKATDRLTIVWSEENDPTTGYEAGGYNNAWRLAQTSQEPLTGLGGTNAALYFFRPTSVGYVSGRINDDMIAAGTVDGIGEAVGTVSPASILRVSDDDTGAESLFFVDTGAKVRRIVGGNLQGDIWKDAAEMSRRITREYLELVQAVVHDELNLVLFAVPIDVSDYPNAVLVFDAGSGQYSGVWTGIDARAIGRVSDADQRTRLMHLEEATFAAFVHATPEAALWSDEDATGNPLAVPHVVELGALGYMTDREKIFNRIDLTLRLEDPSVTELRLVNHLPGGPAGPILLEDIAADFPGFTPTGIQRTSATGLLKYQDFTVLADGLLNLTALGYEVRKAVYADRIGDVPTITVGDSVPVLSGRLTADDYGAFTFYEVLFPIPGGQLAVAIQMVMDHTAAERPDQYIGAGLPAWNPASPKRAYGSSEVIDSNLYAWWAFDDNSAAWKIEARTQHGGATSLGYANMAFARPAVGSALVMKTVRVGDGVVRAVIGATTGAQLLDLADPYGAQAPGHAEFMLTNYRPNTYPDAVRSWAVMKGNTVTMTGLPLGWFLRLGGLAVAADETGTAVFGATAATGAGIAFPFALLEVLNADGELVDIYSSGLVWGGETYSYNGDRGLTGREVVEGHVVIGINEIGRWIRPRIIHEGIGEYFGFSQLQIGGTFGSSDPNAP